MKELLRAIRNAKKDNVTLENLIEGLSRMTYTDINGNFRVGFENVIAGLADDVHELAENNN